MSAPAWIMDAIYASKSECVLNVPNRKDFPWEQEVNPKYLADIDFTSHVPIVPNVLSEIRSSSDLGKVADIQRERRRAKVLRMIEGKRFVVLIEDGNSDPVIVTIGIQDIATFELAIPQHSYDGMAVFEMIENLSGENHGNS